MDSDEIRDKERSHKRKAARDSAMAANEKARIAADLLLSSSQIDRAIESGAVEFLRGYFKSK